MKIAKNVPFLLKNHEKQHEKPSKISKYESNVSPAWT
jgi:hypothetical protein